MPEHLVIFRCVRCPDHYDNLVTVDSCEVCEYNECFKSTDDEIVCCFGDAE